jgi:SM-20-related protein
MSNENKSEQDFEKLISTYIENKIGISEHFLNSILASHLRDNLVALHQKDLLRAAGTGNALHILQDNKVRGDSIYWLDKKNKNPYEDEFFVLMDAFVSYLNLTCYTGITGYEFHYTLYEKGSFYKKHLDQFQNNESRQFSMISYLNEGWVESDGGELLIQLAKQEQKISPTNGKTVLFKSNELEHEVLPTHQNRMSITGWLKRD